MPRQVRSAVPFAVLTAFLAGPAGCALQSAPTAREGRQLYAENGCASCHGARGHGDGPVAGTLQPGPRDFRDRGAFRRGFDTTAIAQTLADGILVDAPVLGAAGAPLHHREGMPKFDHLSEDERRSLALFVMSVHDESRQGAPQP